MIKGFKYVGQVKATDFTGGMIYRPATENNLRTTSYCAKVFLNHAKSVQR